MEAAQYPVSATEQVRYEQSVRTRYATLAVVAGVLLVIQAIIQYTGPHTTVSELTLDLLTAHKRYPLDLIGSILDCGGLIVLAVLLPLVALDHPGSAAADPGLHPLDDAERRGHLRLDGDRLRAVHLQSKPTSSSPTAPGLRRGQHPDSGTIVTLLPIVAQLGSLLLTVGFIWTALNATRVGLLTRFVGYLGAFAGVLVLFPIGTPVPVVQGFWLLAMAVLIAGRWPSGTPSAWESECRFPGRRSVSRGSARSASPRASGPRASSWPSRPAGPASQRPAGEQGTHGAAEAASAGRTRATTSQAQAQAPALTPRALERRVVQRPRRRPGVMATAWTPITRVNPVGRRGSDKTRRPAPFRFPLPVSTSPALIDPPPAPDRGGSL